MDSTLPVSVPGRGHEGSAVRAERSLPRNKDIPEPIGQQPNALDLFLLRVHEPSMGVYLTDVKALHAASEGHVVRLKHGVTVLTLLAMFTLWSKMNHPV